jgi:hypothetical protein
VTYGRAVFEGAVKVDDWGPYDYHRDYNLTYPVQVMADLSWAFDLPQWLVIAYNRIGVRGEAADARRVLSARRARRRHGSGLGLWPRVGGEVLCAVLTLNAPPPLTGYVRC